MAAAIVRTILMGKSRGASLLQIPWTLFHREKGPYGFERDLFGHGCRGGCDDLFGSWRRTSDRERRRLGARPCYYCRYSEMRAASKGVIGQVPGFYGGLGTTCEDCPRVSDRSRCSHQHYVIR